MKQTNPPPKHSWLDPLKDGFLLILPLWATLAIVFWLWNLFLAFFPDFTLFFPPAWRSFPYFDNLVALAFLLALFVLILLLGILGQTFLGRFFVGLSDALLESSPLIKPIYGTLKKLAAMLFSSPKENDDLESKLTEAVLVPYPSEDTWSLAFLTSSNAVHLFGEEEGQKYITVYMPSSPIISSGYYLAVKKEDTLPYRGNPSQAMGLLLSAGSLQQAVKVPAPATAKKKKKSYLRSWFLNGLLIFTPALGTASIVLWLFNWILRYVRTMRILIPPSLQGLIPDAYFGLITNSAIIFLLLLFIYLLGKTAESALGKALQKGVGSLAQKIPIFNLIYEATSTITETFTKGAGESEFFSKAVLVPFPNGKLRALGFVTHGSSAHLMDGGSSFIPIFLPTSPIPTTGWFMNFPKDKLQFLDMPVEQAIALVISLGISSDLK